VCEPCTLNEFSGVGVRGSLSAPSPAMAFLCSPNTTEVLLQQQVEMEEAEMKHDINRNSRLSPIVTSSSSRGRHINNFESDARRLSFSPLARTVHAVNGGPDDVRAFEMSSPNPYTHSPPPVILPSRPISFSSSLSRPLALL
jgi:hypothetical protein